MLRLVADTNTVVSALLWHGAPHRLFEAVEQEELSIACALAARANLIVSGDKDLRVLKTYRRVRIVGAAEALAIVERSRQGET